MYTGFRLIVLVVIAMAENFHSYSGIWIFISVFAIIEFVNCYLTFRQAARLKNATLRIDQPIVQFSYTILLMASNLVVTFIYSYEVYWVVAKGETILLYPLWLLITLYEWFITISSFVLFKRMVDRITRSGSGGSRRRYDGSCRG